MSKAGYLYAGTSFLLALAFAAVVVAFADCATCAVYGYEQCKCCPADCCGPKQDRCCCLHVDKCTCGDITLK